MNIEKRAEILHKAEKCICNDRETQYGSPEDNFNFIANLWTDYLSNGRKTDISVDSKDVAIMMALMKIARIKTGNFKEDSFVDCCGYIACGAEVADTQSAKTNDDNEPRKYVYAYDCTGDK